MESSASEAIQRAYFLNFEGPLSIRSQTLILDIGLVGSEQPSI